MQRRKLFSLALLFLSATFLSPGVRAQTNDREKAAAEIESLRSQIKDREAILLAPSNEDLQTYAGFLSQPHTGLVRLLPREKWMLKLSTPGDGAFYSFARLTQEYGHGSDIMLDGGQFFGGLAGANFGFFVNLGDVSIEGVSLETRHVQPLAEFQTPPAERDARQQQRRAREGFRKDGQTYIGMLPAVVNNTYALRSINYDSTDVLVAFRVVRKDTDGSMVLLWKLLKKYPKPTLERSAAGQ